MSAERQPRQATRAALSPRWPERRGGASAAVPGNYFWTGRREPGGLARPRLARGLSPALSRTTRGSLRLTSGFLAALSSTVCQFHLDMRVHSIRIALLLPEMLPLLLATSFSHRHTLTHTHARTHVHTHARTYTRSRTHTHAHARTHAHRRWPLPSPLPANPPTAAAAPASLPHAHLRRLAVSAPSLTRMCVCTSVCTHTHTCPGYNLQTLLNQNPDRVANYYKTIKTPRLPFSY